MNFVYRFFGGFISGVLFFVSLYFCINKFSKNKKFVLYLTITSLCRIMTLMIAFYFLLNNNYKNILFILVGFIAARIVVTSYVRRIK